MEFVKRIVRNAGQLVQGMDVNDWLIVAVAVIALGVVCMRGYGSRKDF